MNFRKIDLSDAPILRKVLCAAEPESCDFTPGTILMWRDYFGTETAYEDDILFIRVTLPSGQLCHLMPVCADTEKGLRRLVEKTDYPVTLWGVTDEQREIVRSIYGDIDMTELRDSFDYVYDAEEFTGLAGKHFHTQRNHINSFISAYPEWRYEPVTGDNITQLAAFFEKIRHSTDDYGSEGEDALKTGEVLLHNDIYRFEGGILYTGGDIAGFTLGEIIGDVLFVHIEKADKDIRGSYQMLSNQFARAMQSEHGIQFINREDDMGDEGLRRSKLSYRPIKLLKKYMITL